MLHLIYLSILAAMALVAISIARRGKKATSRAEDLTRVVDDLKKRNDSQRLELNDLDNAHKKQRLDHLQLSKSYQDRSSLLQSLQRKIEKLIEVEGASVSQLRKLQSIIDKDAGKEKDALIIHLEQVNSEYVDRLKAAHPSLTLYDYRLCTFIKSGMSTREIATLLNVLPSSVNVSRSRLRKKMSLAPTDDLYTVLNKL